MHNFTLPYLKPKALLLIFQVKMAKLLAFSFLLICFFFAFSQARLPENDVVTVESDPNFSTETLLLPSEKPGSERGTTVELEPESIVDLKEPEQIGSVPLTVVSFRPIDHHFPRRPFPFSLRHGSRCRHGRRQFRPWGPRPHGREIPFGDDMIVSVGEDRRFDPKVQGGVRQMDFEWPPRHHHPHHHHDHEEEGEHEEREDEREQEHEHHHHHEHEHEHGHGFMRSFRKFLKHHF